MVKNFVISLSLFTALATCVDRPPLVSNGDAVLSPRAMMPGPPDDARAKSSEPGLTVGKAQVVAQLPGAASATATAERWNVHGTDLHDVR